MTVAASVCASTLSDQITQIGGDVDCINGFCLKLQALLCEHLPASNMLLCDLTQQCPRLMWIRDYVDTEIPINLANGVTHYLMRHGRSVLLQREDIAELMDSGQVQLIGALPESWMGSIIHNDAGIAEHALVIQSYQQHRFHSRDRALLDQLAPAINAVLTRLRRLQQRFEANVTARLERRSEQTFEVMCQITELCQQPIEVDALYPKFQELLSKLMPAAHFAIGLLTGPQRLEFVYDTDASLNGTAIRINGRGLSEYVIRQQRPVLLTLAEIQQLFEQGEAEPFGQPSACWLGAPLIYAGEAIGAVILQDFEHEHAYGQPQMRLVGHLAHHIANVIGSHRTQAQLANNQQQLELAVRQRTAELEREINQRRQVEMQLRHETLHDHLTGLPNRALIMQRLQQVIALKQRDPSYQYALLFLDLNRFKVINDSLGHLTGDLLLRQVAHRLNGCLRGFDTVARLGGDEFAILLEHIKQECDAVSTAGRIQQTLSKPFFIDNEEVYSGASIGIAFGHRDYLQPVELLRDADLAMYQAKQRHSDQPVVFNDSMHTLAQQRMKLENELQRALDSDQFELYYQPVFTLQSGTLRGFEALVRWQHPSRGLLLPKHFLSIMEESRQIFELDRWVLRQSCQQFGQWLAQYPHLATTTLSINISAEWLNHSDSADVIAQTVNDSGLQPQQFMLEITERNLQQYPQQASQFLRKLKQAGFGVMMDDFGTGYASLSNLHQLQFDLVKIDSSFIGRMDTNSRSETVVKAIFMLCQQLGIEVVAEGIDKPQLITQLLQLGCHYGQGYHLSAPLSASQFLTQVIIPHGVTDPISHSAIAQPKP